LTLDPALSSNLDTPPSAAPNSNSHTALFQYIENRTDHPILQLLFIESSLVLILMPAAMSPNGTAKSAPNGSSNGNLSANANDNIRRFAPPSRPMSPPADHTLFHDKTRCFV
jgi:hypothetical protein